MRFPGTSLRRFALAVLLVSCGCGCASMRAGWSARVSPTQPLGEVAVDPHARAVMATGFVNQTEGPVELLACGRQGKRHESVLVIEAGAADLQTALLLIGAKAGPPMRNLGVEPPQGTALDIEVAWTRGGRTVRRPAEALLLRMPAEMQMESTPWIFTGSVWEAGRFMALSEESLVATYWDPWAIVNLGSPLGADDNALASNPRALPAPGTRVNVYFRLRPAP